MYWHVVLKLLVDGGFARKEIKGNKSGLRGVGMGRCFDVSGREYWRRGSCVINVASQPHLAWGSIGLAAKPAALLHIHTRTTSLSVSAVSAVRWKKDKCKCVHAL